MPLKITTLIENHPGDNPNLIYEHGLSLYIETDQLNILFDTGQTGEFVKNTAVLKCPLNKLDYVIISHGHYDHSGGFKTLMPYLNKNTKLIIGDEFFNQKYKLLANGIYKFNGNSFSEEDLDEKQIEYIKIKDDVYHLNEHIDIYKNFHMHNNFESIPAKFKIKHANEYINDTFPDEIALGIKTSQGLIVTVGCSHRGIVNILEAIKSQSSLPIIGVIGGTHLVEADEQRISKTLKYLDTLPLEFIACSHCTGEAIVKIKEHFKDKFIFNCTGNIIEIE